MARILQVRLAESDLLESLEHAVVADAVDRENAATVA
jgi:hypothetical protein